MDYCFILKEKYFAVSGRFSHAQSQNNAHEHY